MQRFCDTPIFHPEFGDFISAAEVFIPVVEFHYV
jgi:hypothetical protein